MVGRFPPRAGADGPPVVPETRCVSKNALSDRRVTVHSGHIGNTFRPLRETQSAVAGVLQDGRAAAVCGSVTRRREDGGAVPGVRYLAQDRLQDLRPLPGLRSGRAHRSVAAAVPAGQPPALPDRGADRATRSEERRVGRGGRYSTWTWH